MKNSLLVLFSTIALLLPILYCCDQQEPESLITSLTISQTEAELTVGDALNLSVTTTPSLIPGLKIVWSSSVESVAKVSQDGLVEALSEGSTIIKASIGDKADSCIVVVKPAYVNVASLDLNKTEWSMIEGDEVQLIATISPIDATDQTIIWQSSNASLATVSDDGLVKAHRAGEVTITATAGSITAECRISITAKRIAVESIVLDKTDATILVGDELILSATILPDNSTVRTIEKWTSSDENIAIVNEGRVTAKKEGEAVITAYADGKSADCKVTVSFIAVNSISLDITSLSLYEGEEYVLTASITPESATYQDVAWSSSNEAVATVSEGKVLAIKKGVATITAEADGKSSSCSVEVLASIATIKLNKNNLSMMIGDSELLAMTITPDDATLRESITWSSSDEGVVSVDQSGKVTAIKEGEAVISVSVEGKKDECRIVVDYIHVERLQLNITDTMMNVGEELLLTATVSPQNATYQTISWRSSNDKIASVSPDGIVKANQSGTATISAESDGKQALCNVTVVVPVAAVKMATGTSLTILKGQTGQLSAYVEPYDATDKTIKWSSNNEAIATVDQDGLVTAVNGGTAIITASAGDKKAECEVIVTVPVTAISLSSDNLSMYIGETAALQATIEPDDATDKAISWSSSDKSVASVVNGVITAEGEGNATITAQVGGKRARCSVSVKVPVRTISLNTTSLALRINQTGFLSVTVSPDNADYQYDDIVWSSSNVNVATIESSGIVTAIGEGEATITVALSGKTATCDVIVSNDIDFPGGHEGTEYENWD